MRTRWAPAVACALAIALFVADLALRPGGVVLTRGIDDVAELVAAALAATASGWRARGSHGRARASWALVGCGCAAWAIGEAIWCYYELLRGIDTPFPSVADAGFLTFPLLALAGLLVRPSAAFAGQGRLRVTLDASLVAASLFIISWVTALGRVYASGSDNRFAAAVSLAYPASDLVLLTVVVVVLVYARTGDRLGLALLAAGMVGLAVGDSGFAYLTAINHYGAVNLVDAGWVAGFLVVALAALLDRSDATAAASLPPRTALLLPYLPTAVAVGVGLDDAHNGRLDHAITIAGTVLVAAMVARQMLVQLDNRALMGRISHQAFHDVLTGLANRALFNDRLEHALALQGRELRSLAVLLIDVDDFKTVNDSLGHPAGDELLIRISERLRMTVRAGDTVARLGGDEFAVLVEGVADPGEAAHRLLSSLDAPVSVGGRELTVRASVGVATLIPGDAPATATDLLKRADLAMYAAKHAGKATVRAYSPDLELTEGGQFDIRAALVADVAAGRIGVAFQPIHLADGALIGFEALARWSRAGESVAPATFLPIARRAGCLPALDETVLGHAVAAAVQWGPACVLSVNLDGETLVRPGFVERVERLLAEHHLAGSKLAFEVLEGSLIEYDGAALQALGRLRRLGVRVAVDDFGVGYASLVRLQELQPDIVKIDRSLVAAQTDADRPTPLLVGATKIAHQMGAFVVAEGVETDVQLRAAVTARCDAVQGFRLGAPVDAAGSLRLAHVATAAPVPH